MSWLGLEFEIYDETNPRPEDRVPEVVEVIEEVEEEEPFYEYVGCEPCMDFMPMEILIEIFSYLNVSDRFYASLVCSRWLDALTYEKFSDDLMLSFTETLSDSAVPLSFYTFTDRIYSVISLSNVNLDYDSEDFWIENGSYIRELYLNNGLLRKEEFVNVLKYTRNLEVLKIEGNGIFKSWQINRLGYERRTYLRKCYHISLARNHFMSCDLFGYLMMVAPNISELDLSHCFHTMFPAERNRVLDYILAFITENAKQIKLLNFSNTATDDLFLSRLSEIQNLSLRSLSLTFNGCSKNINYGFPALIKVQPNIEEIDLSGSNSVTDNILAEIVSHMKNLKKFVLKKCHNVTDIGIKEFTKLSKLQSLEISNCDHVSDVGLLDGIIHGTPKLDMRKINLSLLVNITENVISKLVYFYGHIHHLDLGGCNIAVSDNALQMILRHMKLLTHLNVDNCCKLSDYGLTGYSSDEKRFESIRNLKGLKTLRCCGLYKITNFALIDSFQFLELKELYLSRCSGVTEQGLKALAENCRSLEVLDLSECRDINDKAIQYVTKYLYRLKTLKLNGCRKVTDKCLEIIFRNCEELRNLHIRNCDIDEDEIDNLSFMRTLRKVYSNLN